jgi:phosphoribosylformylglycinamidine cyclo-ligase
MGNRLDIFTDRETAQSLIDIAQTYQIDAQIIGRVEAAEQKSLLIQSALGEFEYS